MSETKLSNLQGHTGLLSPTGTPSDADLVKGFEIASRIRAFENTSLELARAGQFPGPVHPYIGQEAVAAAAGVLVQPGDYTVSYHRGHGHCIAMGVNLDKMMAELMGRATGSCKGKGGSMHICDFSRSMLGANGIVGGSMALAGGAALASSIRGDGRIVLCFFSDGASNQGIFHETANMAAIWKLPLIFVCENNQYALSFHVSQSTSVARISDRAAGYSMPGLTVDGTDFGAVYGALGAAMERARAGAGPSLVECKTYPWDAHSSVSGQHSFEETQQWRLNDPIPRLRSLITERKATTEEILDSVTRSVLDEVAAAVAFGTSSPEPDLDELETDVFA